MLVIKDESNEEIEREFSKGTVWMVPVPIGGVSGIPLSRKY